MKAAQLDRLRLVFFFVNFIKIVYFVLSVIKNYKHLCAVKVSLSELVEPIDYEEFLQQHSNIISRDPLRHILDFPPCDVQIKRIDRKIRTTEPIVPKENL